MPLRTRTPDPSTAARADGRIRDQLEQEAWQRYPVLAERLSRRRRPARLRLEPLRWYDRLLLGAAIVLLCLSLSQPGAARAEESWGLEFVTAEGHWPGLALTTEIRVDVTGLLARVQVQQSFLNRGDEWAEGVYRFPLPDGAAVDRMRVQVGDRVIEGEIQPREEARRVYQQARAAGQLASIVEQQRPNQYESRLANIGPGETIHVSIGFLCNVAWADGSFSLRLPMTFTPRWEPSSSPLEEAAAGPALHFASAGSGAHAPLSIEVLLRSGIGYASIESRYHDVDIEPAPEGFRVTLLGDTYLPDRDFELSWVPALAAAPQAELLTWDGGDAVYAQLMLVPPLLDALGPQAREVVFIIDTSGSMQGASLEQARAALVRGLEQLGAADAFNLIQFNSETEILFPRSVPATGEPLATARDFLDSLDADGGTVMAPALAAAFALPHHAGLLRQVIFITDGSAGNEPELLLQIAEQLGDSRLFTVGIGSAPNAWFMRKAAEIGRGGHTLIGRLDDVEQRMASLWDRLRHPALADICIDFGADAEYYPEIIPDLYAGDPLWVTARLPLQPGAVSLCGEFDGAWWEHTARPRPSEGAAALATLWARRKIEALEDSLMFGAEAAEIRSAVTDLALAHGLLTRYTSLVAVDRTPARPAGEALESSLVPNLLPAGSTLAVSGFPRTDTGWLAQVLLSCLTLLVATGMFLFSGARLPLASSRAATGSSRG